MMPTPFTTLTLLPNVQFLYELHLAALELKCLSAHAQIRDDFRAFTLRSDQINKQELASVLKRSAYIGEADGVLSDYAKLTQYNLTRAFNQYITHWFYPYKGKYHPQMVRALANIIGLQAGDTLLDPFIGSGTTAVEGVLLKLKVVGFDISPLCVLISSVKSNAVHHFSEIKKSYANTSGLDKPHNDDGMPNSQADPVKSFELLANMIATSDSARRQRDFDTMLIKNREKMMSSIRLMLDACAEINIAPHPVDIKNGDARDLPLADNSVDGVITSPPYSLALNYVENDAHSLAALGYDVDKIREEFVGVRGRGKEKINLYEQDMRQAYAEIARVLKPSAKAAIVIGDAVVNGNKVQTAQKCIATFEKLGFKLTHNIDKLIYGLYNIMQREAILIFERE